jgi:hypothetical protein
MGTFIQFFGFMIVAVLGACGNLKNQKFHDLKHANIAAKPEINIENAIALYQVSKAFESCTHIWKYSQSDQMAFCFASGSLAAPRRGDAWFEIRLVNLTKYLEKNKIYKPFSKEAKNYYLLRNILRPLRAIPVEQTLSIDDKFHNCPAILKSVSQSEFESLLLATEREDYPDNAYLCLSRFGGMQNKTLVHAGVRFSRLFCLDRERIKLLPKSKQVVTIKACSFLSAMNDY